MERRENRGKYKNVKSYLNIPENPIIYLEKKTNKINKIREECINRLKIIAKNYNHFFKKQLMIPYKYQFIY